MEENKGKVGKKKNGGGGGWGSIWTIFMHADGVDVVLMILGFIGAVGDGLTLPLTLFITSKLMNNIGGSSNFNNPDAFTQTISKVFLAS